jgi:hypothetical protein
MDRHEEIKGHTYSIGKMDAFEQLHVARRLAPMVSELMAAFISAPSLFTGKAEAENESKMLMDVLEIAGGPLADAFSKMSNVDVDYIVHACLSVCQRKQSHGYAKVFVRGGGLAFQDIQLDTLLGLTWFVIQENLAGFFTTSQPISGAQK